jgi:hypothetical protein
MHIVIAITLMAGNYQLASVSRVEVKQIIVLEIQTELVCCSLYLLAKDSCTEALVYPACTIA